MFQRKLIHVIILILALVSLSCKGKIEPGTVKKDGAASVKATVAEAQYISYASFI